MRVGVLGGTFDPVHIGHLLLAEEGRGTLGLERVLFVPAGEPWRKAGRELSSAEHRLAMVRLAVEDARGFEVSTVEIERRGPTYTADTLEALRQEMSSSGEAFFIMGQDALADLPHWRDPERIIAVASLAVASRVGWEDAQAAALEERVPGISERLVWLDMPHVAISSTAVRDRVRQGLSIRYWVPAPVEDYIRQNSLYVG
jgi:nicotinate-nucleotide adenylyltransferase